MTIIKCFSALVAAGEGNRCAELRDAVRAYLRERDPETGVQRSELLRTSNDRHRPRRIAVRRGLVLCLSPLLTDIEDHFLWPDLEPDDSGVRRSPNDQRRQGSLTHARLLSFCTRSPRFLDAQDQVQVAYFRRTLERAMACALWAGAVGSG